MLRWKHLNALNQKCALARKSCARDYRFFLPPRGNAGTQVYSTSAVHGRQMVAAVFFGRRVAVESRGARFPDSPSQPGIHALPATLPDRNLRP